MHLRYLAYVIRHKWFVLLAGLRLGVPLGQLLMHDLSKFRPDEWHPYVRWFYAPSPADPAEREWWRNEFHAALHLHYCRNPHHSKHWVRPGGPVPMPDHYIREMIADWIGAGLAQGHGLDVHAWYHDNATRMPLHPATRKAVERYLAQIDRAGRVVSL